jgi:ubiquinol oxidase
MLVHLLFLFIVVQLSDWSSTEALVPIATPRVLTLRQTAARNHPRLDVLSVTPNGIPTSTTGDTKSTAATRYEEETLRALENLRARQASELKETERLIRLIQLQHNVDENGVDEDDAFTTAWTPGVLIGFDYGFVSRSEGPPPVNASSVILAANQAGGPPSNIWKLGSAQFMRNLRAMIGEYTDEPDATLTSLQESRQELLKQLRLNSTEIWRREEEYNRASMTAPAPWVIQIPYFAVCYMLDVIYEHRYIPARFFLLETVARMPYMSYISMLHLYETLGFWRRSADMKRIHFAEELNEYRHLLIMESLGGDQAWIDRFIAQHSAIVYYVVLCILWALSPSLSYKFSEMLETHAVNTYSVFLSDNEELLKKLPPSKAAVEYYALGTSDPFYAEFQTSTDMVRRPRLQSLYDVFAAIRDDEGDHVRAMQSALDENAVVQSPSVERRILTGLALIAAATVLATAGMGGDWMSADLGDMVATETESGTLLEALAAGAAATAQQAFRENVAEDVGRMEITASTLTESLERFGKELFEFLIRLL